jgi:PAS domain S-box-containing protein
MGKKVVSKKGGGFLSTPDMADKYLNIAGTMIIVLDKDGRIALINRKGVEILGGTRDELVGMDWFENFIPKDSRDEAKRKFDDIVCGKAEITEEVEDLIITEKGEHRTIFWYNSLLIDPEGEVTGILSSGYDVTEKKEWENKLKKASREWRATIDSIEDLVSIQDRDLGNIKVNKAFADHYGAHPKDLVGKKSYELGDGIKKPRRNSPHNLVLRTKKKIVEEFFEPNYGVYIESSTTPIFNDEGEVVGTVNFSKDITEKKLVREALDRERKAFHLIANTAVNATDTRDLCQRIVGGLIENLGFDSGTIRLYDETKQELKVIASVGLSEVKLRKYFLPQKIDSKKSISSFVARTQRAIFAPNISEHEIYQTHKARLNKLGVKSLISWPIFGLGQKLLGVLSLIMRQKVEIGADARIFFATVAEMFATALDRKLAEEKIKQSLREKEVLLGEIHHRVKNNLQIISSLLDMMSSRTKNKETIESFTEARNKINTIALIHTQIYRSDSFEKIDMGKHIRELIDHLSSIYSSRKVKIEFSMKESDIYLPITQAVPCALALNEIITNAFKHAFREGEDGTVDVIIAKPREDLISIKIRDDGVGIPDDDEIDKIDTIGLKLVKNLVREQLGGKLDFRRDKGTEITIEFDISKQVEKSDSDKKVND